jgi:hypothetical protein
MEAVEELLMKMTPMQGQLRSYLVSALQYLQMDLHQAGSAIFADGIASTGADAQDSWRTTLLGAKGIPQTMLCRVWQPIRMPHRESDHQRQ